jgi:hypothetical protein
MMRAALIAGALAGALADGNATKQCEPFRVVSDHNGFGNAIFALYRAFAQAQRCGTSVEILSNKAKHDRLSRICARLTCDGAAIRDQGSFKWGEDRAGLLSTSLHLQENACPPGCRLRGGKRIHVTRVPVDSAKFTPSNNGEWLAPLTCVGGNNTGKFTTAAHIRSIRFDFEKSPKEVLTRARTHPDDRENDTMSSYMGRDDGHMLYDVDEWRFLAKHVSDGNIYIASDNAPARDELAMRIAELGGTACFVARTSGHSSWHYGEEADDHALTDWWYLAQAQTIHQIDLRCRGRTAHSCQFNRKRCPRGSVKRGRNNAGMGHCRGSSFSHAAHRLYAGTRTRAHTCVNCQTLSALDARPATPPPVAAMAPPVPAAAEPVAAIKGNCTSDIERKLVALLPGPGMISKGARSASVAWQKSCVVARSLVEIRATLNPARDLVEAVETVRHGVSRRPASQPGVTRSSRKGLGDVFFEAFLALAEDRLLALDACPAAAPTKTLIWFVTPRDARARLCIKLALASLQAEAQGWGLRLVHTHPEAAKAVVEALPQRCRGRVALKSVKDLGADVILMKQKWGDDKPEFTRWDLSCLQASAVYYEGLEAPVVIAGGEDVLVRRPITADELSYTMLGAPWRRTHIRFGGNGGFAVRDPAFVRAEGILIDPRENLDAWANACRKMGRRADDVTLAYKLARLHDVHKLGAFRPAPRKALQGFAAEMVESPGDPAALHAAWRHLSIDYVVRQFEKVVSVIRDFEAPA